MFRFSYIYSLNNHALLTSQQGSKSSRLRSSTIMINRGARPRLLRRPESRNRSSATASLSPKVEVISHPKPPTDDGAATVPVVNFTDTKKLFSSVSSPKLLRSLVMLGLSANKLVADFGSKILNSSLMNEEFSRKTILAVTEHTFYRHFCAGEDLAAANATAKRLRDTGLTAMLDYGLEHADNNESCDSSMKEFIRTIDFARSDVESPVSFVVVKITAICPPRLLKRVSDLLRWQYKDNSMNLPWKHKSLPLLSDASPLYHTPEKPEPLTAEEERHLDLAYARMSKICRKSTDHNIPILVDAEDTAIQPAIDYFTYTAAIEFTRGNKKPLIYNTIQAYLRDAMDRLVIAEKAADEMSVPLGIKLVRGAYMASEKKLTDSLGVKSPIHDSINDTHDCYNNCADFMLHQIARRSGALVLATHNMESGKLAAVKANDLGINKDENGLHFAQLYGMADPLSFGLRNAGFRVSKYLPFGPVDQIVPYLLRRAEENRGLLSASFHDRQLMKDELVRRMRSHLFKKTMLLPR